MHGMCNLCHKKENSKAMCIHGHYVCNECHTAGLDVIAGLLGGAMTLFDLYEEKMIRLTDNQGNTFTGVADTFPAEYGEHEYGTEEEGIKLGDTIIFRSQIRKVEFLPTYEEAVATIPLGRYCHFKGNEYEVIAIARHSETAEPMVVYRALYGEGGVWVRPADMWSESVERDGKVYKRFERIV